ncbi:MAG: RNA polymerase sigma factor [Clostridia bacterium]
MEYQLHLINGFMILSNLRRKLQNTFFTNFLPKEDKQGKSIDFQKALFTKKTEDILDQYGNTILRLAYSYLHNLYDAEEVVQEVLIKYLKYHPSFENAAVEKAWLMRVTINISKNLIKFNKIRTYIDLEDSPVICEDENLTFVWEAVKNLPIKYREVIHLFYHEGYSTKEMSMLLHKKEATIRSLLYRGRQLLKEELKEGYDFEI